MSMTRATPLILLSAALCLVDPAGAQEARSQTSAFKTDTSARQHDMSSRHGYAQHGRIVAVSARACRGFTIAPTQHKTYRDRRWPYVNWRGACDSLYAPGPLVTFVGHGSY
jgi:hypothetical protein